MKIEQGKRGIFFGWWIVLASAVIAAFIGGTWFYGFTVFVNPIVSEFGWSYFAISLASSLRGIEMGVGALLMGYLTDKFGPRRILIGGGIVAGIGLILLSQVNSLPMFYLVFILTAVGFSACDMVVTITTVANWFSRRVGLAVGVATLGFGFSGLVLPVLNRLIETYDWRLTYTIIGIATWVIILSLAAIFRHKPEQYGYLPDGDQTHPKRPDNQHLVPIETDGESSVDFGIKQAIKERSFWLLAVTMSIIFMGYAAVALHIVPFLVDIGYDSGFAAVMAGFLPLSSIAGRLLFGWLSDMWGRKQVLALTFGLITAGLVLLRFGQVIWVLWVCIILFGSGFGGMMVLRAAAQREYFGRRSFGTIGGLMALIATVGGVIGPMIAGRIFDTSANYNPAWLIFAVFAAITVPVILLLKPVKQQLDS